MLNNDVVQHFKTIPGAISVTEAIALYHIIITNLSCSDTLRRFVDLGSHAGKSSLIALTALNDLGVVGEFQMVDPAFDVNDKFREGWKYFSEKDYIEKIRNSVKRFIINPSIYVNLYVLFYGMTSEEFCHREEPVWYVFIDTGEHSAESLAPEVAWVERNLMPGGIVVFHDYMNQYTAPKEAADRMIESKKFELIPIDWAPIIEYVKENNLEEGNNSWHMLGNPNPNFIGALRRCR